MSSVTVEFPVLEAMALAKRLEGKGGLSAAEADAAQRAHQRIASAVQTEAGYESGIETIAESLVGEDVRVETNYGKVFEGELEKITGFRSIVVKDEPFSHPVNLSLVKSIKAREAVAA